MLSGDNRLLTVDLSVNAEDQSVEEIERTMQLFHDANRQVSHRQNINDCQQLCLIIMVNQYIWIVREKISVPVSLLMPKTKLLFIWWITMTRTRTAQESGWLF